MIEFYVAYKDFGRYLDVYAIERSFDGANVIVFKGPNEFGTFEFETVPYPEGSSPPAPSFSLPQHWVGPLVDALTDGKPGDIEQVVLDTLMLEQGRVDRLIGALIAPPIVVNSVREQP